MAILFGSERFVRRQDVDIHRLPDESLLVLDNAGDMVYPLNESGALIWELCDGTHNVEQVVSTLADRYDVAVPQVRQDTQQFLSALECMGLMTLHPPGADR